MPDDRSCLSSDPEQRVHYPPDPDSCTWAEWDAEQARQRAAYQHGMALAELVDAVAVEAVTRLGCPCSAAAWAADRAPALGRNPS